MYAGLAVAFHGFTGSFREAEMCPDFPPPQATSSSLLHLGENLYRIMHKWQVASCKYVKGRDNLNDGITVNLLR